MVDIKPRCRLYLQVEVPLTARCESELAQALAESAPACVLLRRDVHADEADAVIDLVQGAAVACLLDEVDAAERLGADGAHISAEPDLYRRARARLGKSANIGVACGMDRHAAMLLAEAGADYVAFGATEGATEDFDALADLIAWWSEIFLVPCVAWNVGRLDQAVRLASLGADFMSLPSSIWQHEAPARTIAEFYDALERARRAA